MAELLLELLSEEIPARMQARAAEDLKRLVTERLREARLEFETARSFVTPRRLCLVVDGLPEKQPDIREESEQRGKGLRVDAPQKAIHGFLRSLGLDQAQRDDAISKLEDLPIGEWHSIIVRLASGQEIQVSIAKRTLKKGLMYVYKKHAKGRSTADLLLMEVLPEVLSGFSWSKSMRWGSGAFTWVRPLHSILLVFGDPHLGYAGYFSVHKDQSSHRKGDKDWSISSFTDVGTELSGTIPDGCIPAGNTTRGHRFLAPKPFSVKNFADYKAKLRRARVMLDPAERRAVIKEEAENLAAKEGLTVKEDDGLLAEVAGLVEWPVALIGSIDEEFMDLPPEVLTTVMRQNQKYFALLKKDGVLAPRFIVVADTAPDDGGEAIVAGNERVLRARLADARFFWDQDRNRTLESRLPALEDIIFHAKLGKMSGKVERMQTLAAEIGARIPGCDPEQARRAARLCKADLTTEMVVEFPELQGVMGRYYALADGEPPEVADAIAAHYAPQGPDDRCPTAPISVAVALADKIDTLAGFFAIGEKPTGSKDPYALRRAALGVIRLIIENNLRLSLAKFFGQANHLYAEPETGITGDLDPQELLDFFAERLKVHLKEQGVAHDLISAVFAVEKPEGGGEDDLVRLLARVDALKAFLSSDDGEHLLTAYKRASNIVRIEEKRDGKRYNDAPVVDYFEQDEEKALHASLTATAQASSVMLENEDFSGAMAEFARLRGPVDRFFDEVTVNCEEQRLRANRLRLLSEIRSTLGGVADFSRIEGESRR